MLCTGCLIFSSSVLLGNHQSNSFLSSCYLHHSCNPEAVQYPLIFCYAGMLSLKDLADAIAEKLQKRLFVGAELCGRKDNGVFLCKISKVLEEAPDKIQYEVAWLDKNKKVTEKSLLNREDLIHKKLPFSRNVLKSFIRESTYRSAPWVLHDKLARNYGISTDPPGELEGKVFFKDGQVVCNMKRRKNDEDGKSDLVIIYSMSLLFFFFFSWLKLLCYIFFSYLSYSGSKRRIWKK